jgi:hypothetical protein
MTSLDVETVWPRATCTTATRTCLQALPTSTLDLGSCGIAVDVNACAADVGVFVDDVSFQAKLKAADNKLATATVRAEAVSLVGAVRADPFLYGALQTVEDRLQKAFGRWFLSTATRDLVLDGVVDAGFDAAYARPLELVDPIAPQPGNVATMRNVAADAVLAELASKDFVHSEFARTLESLTHQFHAQHVGDIEAFRETVVAEPYMTTKDVYIGSWLGLYTEVVIDRATGTVESTLVEID